MKPDKYILDAGLSLPNWLFHFDDSQKSAASLEASFDPILAANELDPFQNTTSSFIKPEKKVILLDCLSFVDEDSVIDSAADAIYQLKQAGFEIYFKINDETKLGKITEDFSVSDISQLLKEIKSNFTQEDYVDLALESSIAKDQTYLINNFDLRIVHLIG